MNEILSGSFGGMAARSENRAQWQCYDSDYGWIGVVDDFGVIVPLQHTVINMRGY